MMMLQTCLLYIGMLLGFLADPEADWKLIKNEQGIKVYTGNIANSEFKSVRIEAVFEGSLEKFTNILLDIPNQRKWVYGTEKARLLKKISDQEFLYYVETDLPWPASNRDTIIRMRLRKNRTRNTLSIASVGEPRAYPQQPNKVRVPHFVARWEIKETGPNKISITYVVEANPGGNLSPMIVNMFLSKGPFETFRNLGEMLKH